MVFSAWPYVNAIPHLGNLVGSVLSADVAARFLRMTGAEVVFASGSDQHGTPIEVEAIKKGINPKTLADEMHEKVKCLFEKWRISFDNYSKTDSEHHRRFVQDFYKKVYERGYIFDEVVQMLYCPKDSIFLPDRFVEGTCPYCGYEKARGDQCDSCGRLLDPLLLKDPRCVICNSVPVVKETRHWFFNLPKLEKELADYIRNNGNLPDNARNMSLQMLKEGLRPRSLTRDSKWGIPAPFPGAEGKTIYVWMEAVLGYISAVIEHFEKKGDPKRWKEFWLSEDTKSVYFIGKDNIPFHTIIFPALLMASGSEYVLPWTVSSTEYLTFEGDKFSKSRGVGIWIDEALELLPVDYWRFSLIAMRPEVRDTDFRWKSFQEIVNSQLNDIIGNFIHRVLTLIYRRFGGVLEPNTALEEDDSKLLEKIRELINEWKEHMYKFRFKVALSKVIEIASEGNRYINEKRPWELPKEEAAKTLYVAANIIKVLAILLTPIIPDSAARIWKALGLEGNVEKVKLEEAYSLISSKIKVKRPSPIFRKISDEDLNSLKEKLKELRKSSR
ncbi:MAG: methionine--tRNA ligase [Thermoprotei archaeon]|nr:MAG: methionine--tRNA ligase [Thermoprotei archaeon]